MVIGNPIPSLFFNWKFVGFFTIFITAVGWTYYLLVQIINTGIDFFDLAINDISAGYVFSLMLIHFSVFLIVTMRLIKRGLASKKKLLAISLSGLSVTLLFLLVYHTNPKWLL